MPSNPLPTMNLDLGSTSLVPRLPAPPSPPKCQMPCSLCLSHYDCSFVLTMRVVKAVCSLSHVAGIHCDSVSSCLVPSSSCPSLLCGYAAVHLISLRDTGFCWRGWTLSTMSAFYWEEPAASHILLNITRIPYLRQDRVMRS